MTITTKVSDCISRLIEAGLSNDDAAAVRRAAMTLHRWYEMECGSGDSDASWSIERDEETGKPVIARYPHRPGTARIATPIPDREKGAKKRIENILAHYPGLSVYYQTDPRGAPVYILRPSDIPAGERVESFYSRGIAVYR